jgi:hypothetical protein
VTWYFRPDKVRHLSLGQMMHNLILTRFLVSAKKLTGERTEFKLLQVKTCYEVGSDYPSVEVVKEGKKERVKVIPDAWPLKQAVEDGVLVEIFKKRWPELSGGKPIVATAHLFEEISLAGLMEIWNEFVKWQKEVMSGLPGFFLQK